MSGSQTNLPFLKILVPIGIRSDGTGKPGTDRDLLSVQLHPLCIARIRPILSTEKSTNRLALKGLPFGNDIRPLPSTKGAKIYSFWAGFEVVAE
jgi:hypothetical protein